MSEIQITLTQNAAKKVYELIQEEGNPQLKLQIYITGGGCSGFQYGFNFTEETSEADFLFFTTKITDQEEDEDGNSGDGSVTLVVDPISGQYLHQATVDYKTGPEGEYFSIDNPNAKTTCGCGSSFSI